MEAFVACADGECGRARRIKNGGALRVEDGFGGRGLVSGQGDCRDGWLGVEKGLELMCRIVRDVGVLAEHFDGFGKLIGFGGQLKNMAVHVAGVPRETGCIGVATCTVGLMFGRRRSRRGAGRPFVVAGVGVGHAFSWRAERCGGHAGFQCGRSLG